MSLDQLAQATCAIWVDGHRAGTGTLVAQGQVLTAAHVLRRSGPVEVRFRDELGGEPLPSERVVLSALAHELDIAVLQLSSDARTPQPAGLWPANRLPSRTKAYGYPIAEGRAPRGVWCDSVVGGPVQGGRVQLDWENVGTLRGHSGGPVADRGSGLIVGVLVEGSEAGHFDRMIPLSMARRAWSGLPRPWLFAGEDARRHFSHRATGLRSIARGGDLFRGRVNAVKAVSEWLRHEDPLGVPLVVTAQPGAGKSAVLARAALRVEQTAQFDGVAFHARRASVADLVDAVSGACGLDTPSSWQELTELLVAVNPGDVLVVVVDALDEAASYEDLSELRRALRELARVDKTRVAVATRPLAARSPYRPGTHLYGLGITHGGNSRNLIDLDSPEYFASEDLRAYAEALLAQEGIANPGPPGAAWARYREEPDLTRGLADVIAKRAGRNYLVVGMSAYPLAEDEAVLDPRSAGFDVSSLPSGVGEALSKYLVRLPDNARPNVVGLLTALAYGRGAGLSDERWLAFTRALGSEDVTLNDLALLRNSAAADYLLEASTDSEGVVTRLFHEALAEELSVVRDRRNDEHRLVRLLRDEAGAGGWPNCSPYARNYAPSHAAAGGLLEGLAKEAGFLVGMAPTAMRPELAALPIKSQGDPAAVYGVAFPFLADQPGVNAAVLEFVSYTQGNRELSRNLHELDVSRVFRLSGKVRPFDRALAAFNGHTGLVSAVAPLAWPGVDHPVLATTSQDGTARVWDPHQPDTELARFEGHTNSVMGVTALAWPGLDHPVLATTSSDGTARVWDPQRPDTELARFDGHESELARSDGEPPEVVGVTALAWPGLDHPVLATTSQDGTARVWDPQQPDTELARFDGHTNSVTGVTILAWPGLDRPVLATTSFDRTARVWDPQQPDTELARFEGHTRAVNRAIPVVWPGLDHPVLATTSEDGTARVWDPHRPDTELARFAGHTGIPQGVTTLAWPGVDYPVLATTSQDGTARVWDPHRPDTELARFAGHTGTVEAVTTLAWPGVDHPVLATTSSDGTTRIWDPHPPHIELAPFDGHAGTVSGVTSLAWPGLDHPVLATTSFDGTARIWDPQRPDTELARYGGQWGPLGDVTTLVWPGLDHPVLAVSSWSGTARVWDPQRPDTELARFEGHPAEVLGITALAWPGLDHPVLATTSADDTARVWDPQQPDTELAYFDGHTDAVWGVTALAWPGLDHPVLATTSYDCTAQVWDPQQPDTELAYFDGHTARVLGVTALAWPGLDHPVLATTSNDRTARVWDPQQPDAELARFEGHTGSVFGVTTLAWPGLDHPVLATTSYDGTARVWDPQQADTELARVPLLGAGLHVTTLGRTTLAVATVRGFLVIELTTVSTG